MLNFPNGAKYFVNFGFKPMLISRRVSAGDYVIITQISMCKAIFIDCFAHRNLE